MLNITLTWTDATHVTASCPTIPGTHELCRSDVMEAQAELDPNWNPGMTGDESAQETAEHKAVLDLLEVLPWEAYITFTRK